LQKVGFELENENETEEEKLHFVQCSSLNQFNLFNETFIKFILVVSYLLSYFDALYNYFFNSNVPAQKNGIILKHFTWRSPCIFTHISSLIAVLYKKRKKIQLYFKSLFWLTFIISFSFTSGEFTQSLILMLKGEKNIEKQQKSYATKFRGKERRIDK
jgi:hypothetical protein